MNFGRYDLADGMALAMIHSIRDLTPNIPAASYAADPRAQRIAAAAARLDELRNNWLNPADLVRGIVSHGVV